MKSAITLCLFPEAKGGPFVFWDNLEEGFQRAAAHGFDAIELFPGSAAEFDRGKVKKLCAEYKLKVSAVGTGAGWVKHKLRLTDPDAGIRRRAEEFILAIIDLAGGLGAPAIVGSMQGRWGENVSREQAVHWLAEGLEKAAARAADYGVPLLYEPLNRYETNLFNCVAKTVDFLATLRTKNVKILADLFHMNIEEADVANALRHAGDSLGHVHFVDSNRRAVGLGHLPMVPVIAALREISYTGYLSAEVFPLPDSETAAQQTIRSFRTLVGSTQ